MTKSLLKTEYSVKAKILMTVSAVVFAVVLPQIFHMVGGSIGVGTSLGEIFLPMHLPIILLGLIAGPMVGFVGGVSAPVISFLIVGMPVGFILPFIVIEMAAYGFVSGIIRSTRMISFSKVLVTQISGRLVRAVAVIAGVYVFSVDKLNVSIIWDSIIVGIPGIILQLCLLPMVIYAIERKMKSE